MTTTYIGWVAFAASVCIAAVARCGAPASNPTAPKADSAGRVVNLGDSITDGQTYALIVEQALRDAGKPVPRFIGAGIGGDTAAAMLKRIDRDVLSRRPTLVMLSCGVNDAGTGVKPKDFEATVSAIAEKLRDAGVKLMLLTTTDLAPRHAAAEPQLREFNDAMRRVGSKYGLTVADVYGRMEEGRPTGENLWEADGCHLNFAGYRRMARGVLDALGNRDVPVPAELHLRVLPGVLPAWKILALTDDRPPLDEKSAAALRVDDAWKDYTLPEDKPVAESWWLDQERRRGVSISLAERFGPAKSYLAVAEIDSPAPREVWINTGGELAAVWLDGRPIVRRGDPPRGWHPGSCRARVRLHAGKNRIVVETPRRFFVSVTDNEDW